MINDSIRGGGGLIIIRATILKSDPMLCTTLPSTKFGFTFSFMFCFLQIPWSILISHHNIHEIQFWEPSLEMGEKMCSHLEKICGIELPGQLEIMLPKR